MSYFWPALTAFLIGVIITPLLAGVSRRQKWLIPVRDRDVHQKPTPRVGGLAILLAFLIVVLITNQIHPELFAQFNFPFAIAGWSIDKRLLGIIGAAVVLVGVMLIDDIRGLSAWTKLAVQILVSLIIIASGIGIIYLNNPFGNTIYLDTIRIPVALSGVTYHIDVIADLVLMVWLILMMNAVNFLDGLDGLAGGIGLIALVVLFVLSLALGQPATALVAAIFGGALLGFLPYNFRRAKAFLGDSGAMLIGLLLGVLAVISGAKFASVLLVLGVAVIDAAVVIVVRLVRGKNPLTTPDQNHLHHRLLKAGFSAGQSVAILWTVALVFGLLGLLMSGRTKIIALGWLIATVSAIIGLASILSLRRRNGRTRQS